MIHYDSIMMCIKKVITIQHCNSFGSHCIYFVDIYIYKLIKFKNHYDCEGTYNSVENYYYDAKRIIDKIKKNRKYKKIYE